MDCGNEKSRPYLPQSGEGQSGEIVSRRRGRPPKQIPVAVSYRPQSLEEEHIGNYALRLLLASLVRSRLGEPKEKET